MIARPQDPSRSNLLPRGVRRALDAMRANVSRDWSGARSAPFRVAPLAVLGAMDDMLSLGAAECGLLALVAAPLLPQAAAASPRAARPTLPRMRVLFCIVIPLSDQ